MILDTMAMLNFIIKLIVWFFDMKSNWCLLTNKCANDGGQHATDGKSVRLPTLANGQHHLHSNKLGADVE